MQLAKLLELHNNSKNELSLPLNFGDGLLCETNLIYRNIRTAASKAGYKFSHESNNFYEALPLAQLENILQSKLIPYTDNVTVLNAIENLHPKMASWDDISLHLKRNFIFHESCHAVARSSAVTSTNGSQALQVLNMLIEESFANTCELMAVCDANEPGQKIFYEINSYTTLFESKELLQSLSQELGFEYTMKYLILVYLFSNYLYESLTEEQFKRILNLAGDGSIKNFAKAQLKKLHQAAAICFTLDKNFKMVTTSFYMRLNGIKTQTKNHLTFDFLTHLENEPKFQAQLTKIAKCASQN